eukprot:gene2997-biopygen2108
MSRSIERGHRASRARAPSTNAPVRHVSHASVMCTIHSVQQESLATPLPDLRFLVPTMASIWKFETAFAMYIPSLDTGYIPSLDTGYIPSLDTGYIRILGAPAGERGRFLK